MSESSNRKDSDRENGYRDNKKNIGIAAAIGLGVVLLFFLLYYRVTEVNIQESVHYTRDEIQEMVLRGPFAGNSILAPMLYSKKVKDIPYVEAYEVAQLDRHTILVSVKEKQTVGCLRYLDCYVYFDSNGKILDISTERDEKIAFFDGLQVDSIVQGEALDIEQEILNSAVSLSHIFEKNEMLPDHIMFNSKNSVSLKYGEIEVAFGKSVYLEDKLVRMLAILPKLEGKKGILHLESVSDTGKNITFEEDKTEEIPAEQERLDENGNPLPSDTEQTEEGENSWETSEWEDDYDNSYGYDAYGSYDSTDYGYNEYDYNSYDYNEYDYNSYAYDAYDYNTYDYNDYSYSGYDYSAESSYYGEGGYYDSYTYSY